MTPSATDRSSRAGSRSSGRSTCSAARTSPSRIARILHAPTPMLLNARPELSSLRRHPPAWVPVYGRGGGKASYEREFRKFFDNPAMGLVMADFIPAEVRTFWAWRSEVPRALVRTPRVARLCWSSETRIGSASARALSAEMLASSSEARPASLTTSAPTSASRAARARLSFSPARSADAPVTSASRAPAMIAIVRKVAKIFRPYHGGRALYKPPFRAINIPAPRGGAVR